MARTVAVLGAGGVIGEHVVRSLATNRDDSQIIAGDVDDDGAGELESISSNVTFNHVDVTEPSSLTNTIQSVDLVVNCVGPFTRFGTAVLDAAIDTGTDYIDVCDDYDAIDPLLDRHQRAQEAGIAAVVGLGASPGITNVLVSLANTELTAIETVSINVTRSILAAAGPAIPYHLFNSWLGEVPTYTEGERRTVEGLRDGSRTVHFPEPFGERTVYYFGHPESLTLPRVFESLDDVSVRGNFVPATFRTALLDMHDLGLLDEQPMTVSGREIAPVEFAASMLERIGTRVAMDAGTFPDGGAVVVEIEGHEEGRTVVHRYAGTSTMQQATSHAAALGAEFVLDGQLKRDAGVWPPEAVIPPKPFIETLLSTEGLRFWQGRYGEIEHLNEGETDLEE